MTERRMFWLGFGLGLAAGIPLLIGAAVAVFLRSLHERP